MLKQSLPVLAPEVRSVIPSPPDAVSKRFISNFKFKI